MRTNPWLVAAGSLSALAAFLHLVVIAGGPGWYRFFGAGEAMAKGAGQGSLYPPLVTLGIAAILASWSAYAFAGAGLLRRLPLMRTALVLISIVYLARGLLLLPALVFAPDRIDGFAVWSSAIVLIYGIVHAAGTWRAWPALSRRP
jgi:hypothetical protein